MVTVSNGWQAAYRELQGLLAGHPEIKVSQNIVSIPEEVRAEFYRRFDTVREAFVEETYSTLPELNSLRERYLEVERQLIVHLDLQSLSLPGRLETFLHDPPKALTGPLFDSLFGLLQGKTDSMTFEQEALNRLVATATDLRNWGYEIWVTLSLVQFLEPDQVFEFTVEESNIDGIKSQVAEAKRIALGQQRTNPTLRLPDLIVHSRKLGTCVALKLELRSLVDSYYGSRLPNRRAREVLATDTRNLGSRVLLLHLFDVLEKTAILADFETGQVLRPDLALECTWRAELEDTATVNGIKRRAEILQPRLGLYSVFGESIPEADLPPLGENVHLLEVDFEPSRLQALIDRLASR